MRALLLAVVAVHFGFVLAGAAKIRLPRLGVFAKPVNLYRGFSGAHYSWGFFAPDIGSQFRVDFEVVDQAGKKAEQPLVTHGPNEVDLRRAGIVATFWYGLSDPKIRRALAASWAASVFARQADAKKVTVLVQAYHIPSAERIKAGHRPGWVSIYDATFARDQEAL